MCEQLSKALDLARGDLLALDDARGTTLRVSRGTVWITQEKELRDVVLNAGDVWAGERNGLTLVEAHGATALDLVGPGADPARMHLAGRTSRADWTGPMRRAA